MGAQHQILFIGFVISSDKEGILFISGGMVGRKIQRRKIMKIIFQVRRQR